MDYVELANRTFTDSRAFNYALPSTLKNEEEIVFLIQHNMLIHDIKTFGDNAISDWVKLKRKERRMRSIRKCAELLVKLKYAIYQAHEENMDKSGKPMMCQGCSCDHKRCVMWLDLQRKPYEALRVQSGGKCWSPSNIENEFKRVVMEVQCERTESGVCMGSGG